MDSQFWIFFIILAIKLSAESEVYATSYSTDYELHSSNKESNTQHCYKTYNLPNAHYAIYLPNSPSHLLVIHTKSSFADANSM
jgi:hypothetical protein